MAHDVCYPLTSVGARYFRGKALYRQMHRAVQLPCRASLVQNAHGQMRLPLAPELEVLAKVLSSALVVSSNQANRKQDDNATRGFARP
jgi:hypothetical protein